MDYKSTLNLPRSDFSMKADLPNKEPSILKKWERDGIYTLIRKSSCGKKEFILHDGPPYSNGNIHMGHTLNKILKDIVVKFNTMTGMDTPFIPGWDCHGLPVEHQLFKELGLSKYDIGQVDFRKKAHKYAMRYVDIQREEFKRLGVFGDWDNPYLTLDPKYEAQILTAFGKLVEKGYIYKDLKPVNWCAVCETALAEAEVEYMDKTSPSIYVRFKVKEGKKSSAVKAPGADTYFLIWTTTPWTLVANVAIAVHPDFNYVVVETEKGRLIVSEELMNITIAKLSLKTHNVVKKVRGKKLEEITARHPFIDRNSLVVLAEYVSNLEGTGCVHTAPGHGQEDYVTGRKYKLPTVMPVDQKGVFDKTAGKLKGIAVDKANDIIIKDLSSTGDLLHTEEITHSYPYCWRCKKPIIFRATQQYFMGVDRHNLRAKLLDIIKKVRWVPDAGSSRISAMVKNRPDWCLSRQRYWGVPIPAFYCEGCGQLLLDAKVISNIAGIVEKEGSNAFFEKEVDELIPKGTKCKKCKKTSFKKESDIVDVWFESGVSHQAVLKRRRQFPSDLYLEGSDQHRGWFQSALITSYAIDGTAPYKTVLTHGFVVDGEGKKMSKSLGNVISPQEVTKRYGADILRLWVASSDYNEDIRLSEEILKRLADAYRKIRNTLRYMISNIYDIDFKRTCAYKDMLAIDKWALCETKRLVDDVKRYYENYNFHMVYRSVYNFCTVTMSSIYLDILKDRLYTFPSSSRERRSAQSAIHIILSSLIRITAPILSFTAEEAWSRMPGGGGDSVHLTPWPELSDIKRDKDILSDYERLFKIRQDVLVSLEEKRQAGDIGSSLEAKVVLTPKTEEGYKFLRAFVGELSSIFIVSGVELNKADRRLKGEYGIEVARADGEKCRRCWNYSISVGKNTAYKDICERCVKALKNNKEV